MTVDYVYILKYRLVPRQGGVIASLSARGEQLSLLSPHHGFTSECLWTLPSCCGTEIHLSQSS